MKNFIALLLIGYSSNIFSMVATTSYIDEEGKIKSTYLKDHEPNLLGIRHDDDENDVYLDFKISLQYPLFKNFFDSLANADWNQRSLKNICTNAVFDDCYPYISFTGRFAQYIDIGEYGRDSSPVVAKRFNPKIFWRFEKNKRGYVDLEYAHESNGQYISSKASFNAIANDLSSRNKGKRSQANDYISRGWDYWGLTLKYKPASIQDENLSLYLWLQKYIDGTLQGKIEEYFPEWEPSREITRRQQVNGFRVMAKLKNNEKINSWLKGYKLAFIYETGLDDFAKHNTYQVEVSTRIKDIPFMFWVRSGYSSDLSQYFKEVNSVGIALELRTFE